MGYLSDDDTLLYMYMYVGNFEDQPLYQHIYALICHRNHIHYVNDLISYIYADNVGPDQTAHFAY